jgi:hypothetical protein
MIVELVDKIHKQAFEVGNHKDCAGNYPASLDDIESRGFVGQRAEEHASRNPDWKY